MTSLKTITQKSTIHLPEALRVLFVLGTLWGENGITSHLKTLASGLIQKGIQVAIASDLASMNTDAYNQATKAVEDFRSQGIKYFILPFSSSSGISKLRDLPEVMKKLDTIVQEFQPTVIHLHSLSVVPYIHLLKLRYKIPFVSTCHMEPSPSNKKSQIIRLAHKIMPNLFGDRFIAISSELHEIFERRLNVSSNRIQRIYHGADSKRFRPPSSEERTVARSKFGLKENDRVVCLIGRLSPNKGHRLLIEAMAQLKNNGFNVVALCAGKNYLDELEQIQASVSDYGLTDSVQFLGMTDPLPVLWASDVLVLPSQKGTEAFPLVVLEAMLCGVIPIRTPASGAEDQISQGINGFIFPFGDATSLAQKLESVFSDPQMRSRMADSSISFGMKHFTLDHMLEKSVRLYEEMICSM
jgi:glycosyltransferase involved in cell wall biosynthesis